MIRVIMGHVLVKCLLFRQGTKKAKEITVFQKAKFCGFSPSQLRFIINESLILFAFVDELHYNS